MPQNPQINIGSDNDFFYLITWNNVDQDLCRYIALQDHSVFTQSK